MFNYIYPHRLSYSHVSGCISAIILSGNNLQIKISKANNLKV